MSVTATLLIDFNPNASGSDGASGHLSAEVDSRPEGLNGGKTSFQPGDQVYFFVYASSNVTYERPICSAGSISQIGPAVVSREDDLAFPNTNTAALPVPALALSSYKWLGNALGPLALQDEMTAQAAAAGVAVARVDYTTEPDVYRLNSPASVAGETDFTILIYIQGQVNP